MLFAILFAAFSLLCSVLAFKRHPIWGLAFYMATTFVFPPGRWWGYLFGQTRWALLSAALTALAIAFHRGKLNPKPIWFANAPAVIICAYATLMWLQTPWALDLSEHIDGSIKYTKYLVAFWFVYRIADSKEHVRDVVQLHVLGCTLLGVLAFMTGRQGDRLDGVGGPGIDDSNTLGMYLVTAAMIAAGLFLTQRGWRRWLNLAALAIVCNGFVLTNSRGAFLAFVAGMIVLMLLKARQHRRVYWAFALLGAIGLMAIVDDAFIHRMYTIEDVTSKSDEADMSARSRVEVANKQIQMFLDHPLGTGHRGTVVLSTRYLDRKWLTLDNTGEEESAARASHNSFLTALVEQGFFGALLFSTMILWLLAAILRVRKLSRVGADPDLVTLAGATCSALVALHVAGNTADYLMAEVQFWMMASLVSLFLLAESSIGARKAAMTAEPIGALARGARA